MKFQRAPLKFHIQFGTQMPQSMHFNDLIFVWFTTSLKCHVLSFGENTSGHFSRVDGLFISFVEYFNSYAIICNITISLIGWFSNLAFKTSCSVSIIKSLPVYRELAFLKTCSHGNILSKKSSSIFFLKAEQLLREKIWLITTFLTCFLSHRSELLREAPQNAS